MPGHFLAIAKTDKIKDSNALAVAEREKKSQAKHFAIFDDLIANFNSRKLSVVGHFSNRRATKLSEPIAIALASDCRS